MRAFQRCVTASALLALWLFADVAEWNLVGLLVLVTGAVCAFVGARLSLSWRWLAAAAIVLGGAAFLLSQPLADHTHFSGPMAMAAAMTAACLQCLLLLRRTPPGEELGWCCFPLVVTIASAFTYDHVLSLTLGRDFNGFFLSNVDVLTVTAAQLFLLALANRLFPFGGKRARWSWLAALSLIPILGIAVGVAFFFRWTESHFSLLSNLFTPSLSTTYSFPTSSRLSSMLRAQRSPVVVLRYFGEHPPQYLVGRAYNHFERGTWTGDAVRRAVRGTPVGTEYRYQLTTTPPAELEHDRVELAGDGQLTFLPRDAAFLTNTVPAMSFRFAGTLEADTSANATSAYGLERQLHAFLPGQWDELEASRCKDVPKLDPIVSRLAHEWTAHCSTDTERAHAIESELQDHFRYGFEFPFARGSDAIAQFLRDRPAAHCELFASSMTLMLRTLGIPSRYINGFVIKERAPTGEYSLVRIRDAHAWVEAWLEDPSHPGGHHWAQLDPTPPIEVAPHDDGGQWTENAVEWLGYKLSLLGRLTPGQLLESSKLLARRALPWAVALALMAIGFRWFRPEVRRQRRAQPLPGLTLESSPLPPIFEAFEHKAAALGWVREKGSTPLAWAQAWGERSPAARRFVESYCSARYGGARVDAEELDALRSGAAEALAELEKISPGTPC